MNFNKDLYKRNSVNNKNTNFEKHEQRTKQHTNINMSKVTKSVDFFQNHIIVLIDQLRLLVDTGSPSSFSDVKNPAKFTLLNRQFTLDKPGMMDLTPKELTLNVGTHLDGLIGNDILSLFDLEMTKDSMTFGDNLSEEEETIPLQIVKFVMGIPVVEVGVNGVEYNMYFDTGAPISYLDENLVTGKAIGRKNDFYPTLGTFTTDIYETTISLAGVEESVTVGVLPKLLQTMYSMGGTNGILGTEIMDRYKILYSTRKKVLGFTPVESEN